MLELEDDRAHELRNKANLEGYYILTKKELSYLASKSLEMHEQETIKIVFGLKLQEELVDETKKLAKRTSLLAIATWLLVVVTMLSIYFTKN